MRRLPFIQSGWLLFAQISSLILASTAAASWNNPYPKQQDNESILYSSFSERPKHLDPIRAYGSNEFAFIEQIYQAPLQYHFLHRPYRLEPLILTRMPQVTLRNADGEVVPEVIQETTQNASQDNRNNEIAFTDYTLTLKQGIRYQPHPALAQTSNGDYHYHQLSSTDIQQYKTLSQFEHTGTRELVAADLAYQIKRFANPLLHSPLSDLMQKNIVGMQELATTLNGVVKQQGSGYIDLREYSLTGVTIDNDYQLTIRLKGQYPQFIYWLAMPFFAPMPWEAELFYGQEGMKEHNLNLNWYPIGTGPYMLTENNPNLRMTLERNPNFHGEKYPSTGDPGDAEKGLLDDAGKDLPFIDKAIYSLEKESIPSWNKFLQGYYDNSGIGSDSFDQVVNISSNSEATLTDAMREKGIELTTSTRPLIYYLGFNMQDTILGGNSEQARLLRQAIAIALDYEEYVSIFLNGRGIAGQGPIPPGIFGYQEGEKGINPYVYDWVNGKAQRKSIQTAKDLMQQAGYANGIDSQTQQALTLNFDSYDASPDGKARLNWLRKQFAKLNIQLVVRTTDYNRFQEKVRNGNVQMFFWGWGADYPDPENFLFLLYGPNGKVEHKGPNYTNFQNDEFDQLFQRMTNLPNSAERQAVVDQMVELTRYHAPWVFGFYPQSYGLNHAWYSNVKSHSMTYNTLKYKRIDPEQRKTLRQQWNRPIVWPVLIVIALLILLVVPAVLGYRRFEKSQAL